MAPYGFLMASDVTYIHGGTVTLIMGVFWEAMLPDKIEPFFSPIAGLKWHLR